MPTPQEPHSGELEITSGRRVRGSLEVPPSKSVSHRLLNLALLSGTEVEIDRLLEADDIRLFLRALEALGWRLERHGTIVRVIPPLGTPAGECRIDCGSAGTLYRFLVASLCALPGVFVVDGSPRLRERPIEPLVRALRALGAEIEYQGQAGHAPLRIRGATLRGGEASLDAGESSQYLSAILMASCRARGPITLEVTALSSEPYVEITLDALGRFGAAPVSVSDAAHARCFRLEPRRLVAPAGLRVEGDYSAAAYPAAAAALAGGEVTLLGLRRDSPQGDRRFLDLLVEVGARVSWEGERATVSGGELLPLPRADLSDIPDQVPTLAAVAAFCPGRTSIVGVPHLRVKESDRLHAMALELARLGTRVEERPDGLVIDGPLRSAGERVVVDTHDDHRIAMSLALVGLRRGGVVLAHPEVVAKSYPGFFEDLEQLLVPPA